MSRRSGRSRPPTSDDAAARTSDADNSPDIDEGDEVTRCICGSDELSTIDSGLAALLGQEYRIKIDTGLFIQCEKCLVWQHGYCVGLFINEDVPDKYWCEECKPELHRLIYDGEGRLTRTLYRSVNDSRQKLVESETGVQSDHELEKLDKSESKSTRLRSRRSPNETPEATGSDSGSTSNRHERNSRRHGDDHYDAQLQRAIRESARASTTTNDKKRAADSPSGPAPKKLNLEELDRDIEESNPEEETEVAPPKKETRPRPKPRAKPKPRAPASKGRGSTPDNSSGSALLKDELLSQLSRPRFVNDRSTIYELRKRTGAILEWLARTQMELEEERDTKTAQFAEAVVGAAGPVTLFDENLKLMENLTEKILSWEQKFGKYAP